MWCHSPSQTKEPTTVFSLQKVDLRFQIKEPSWRYSCSTLNWRQAKGKPQVLPSAAEWHFVDAILILWISAWAARRNLKSHKDKHILNHIIIYYNSLPILLQVSEIQTYSKDHRGHRATAWFCKVQLFTCAVLLLWVCGGLRTSALAFQRHGSAAFHQCEFDAFQCQTLATSLHDSASHFQLIAAFDEEGSVAF